MEYLSLDAQSVGKLLPKREVNTHKGDYGKLLLICGSRGYTGAAALCALGTLRSGAGLVYLAVPESIYEIEAVKLLEPVIFPMPDEGGMLSVQAVEKIDALLPKMNAIAIGPGLGQSEGTFQVVKHVLQSAKCPVILDADGINVVSKHTHILRDRIAPTVLTPHDGEFLRMGQRLTEDRCQSAVDAAIHLECIMVLKGHKTVITDGKSCYVNNTGNPGMATGGSGDVLTGIIASLIGQGLDPLQAAACGAWLHGAAGDRCAQQIGQYGMLPQDMLQILPQIIG